MRTHCFKHRPAAGVLAALTLLAAACSATNNQQTLSSPPPSPEVSPSSQPPPSSSPAPRPIFVVERAFEHLHQLVDEIGPRPAGSAAEVKAEEYVSAVFEGAGLDVAKMEFKRPDGGLSRNVIGRLKGGDYGSGYILVGAHYDTVKESPGANDNGSGTSTVLALAEAFSLQQLPVEFVGFAVEERQPSAPKGVLGLTHGSRAYVDQLGDPDQIKAMVSVDMIGNGPLVQVVSLSGREEALRDELVALAQSVDIPHRALTKGGVSDHTPFALAGIPAAFLYSGSHPTFHKPSDVFAVVKEPSVERTGRLVLEWILARTGYEG